MRGAHFGARLVTSEVGKIGPMLLTPVPTTAAHRCPGPHRRRGLCAGPLLFGSGCGFGRAFACAKQEAAFAAGVMRPNEGLPSASLADPPCRPSPEGPYRVRQKRKLIHPRNRSTAEDRPVSYEVSRCEAVPSPPDRYVPSLQVMSACLRNCGASRISC